MSALALDPGRSLVAADLLKLRTRRGLIAVTSLLTIGGTIIAYAIMALLHATSPQTHGPAGGIVNLGHGAWLLSTLGGIAAMIVAAIAGTGDLEAGVYRDLVVTGRSRLALYASRIPGGLLFLLPFVIVAYVLTALATTGLAGGRPVPGTGLLATTGLWVLLQVVFYYLLALGLACVLGSRAYAIGVALAWRLALTPLLASLTSFGVGRELVPGVGLQDLAPTALGNAVRQGPNVPMTTAAIAAVLLVWTIAAVVAGAWSDTTRDA